MRKLCRNYDREDGLETVLEVPIPEDMFSSPNKASTPRSWANIKSCISSSGDDVDDIRRRDHTNVDIQLLLGVVGAPLIPLPIPSDHLNGDIKDHPIEASMAKYIVQQYIAATGGEKALSSVESMYAMGKVRMVASSEFCTERKRGRGRRLDSGGGGEVGGFVLWQKRPELWCLELVVSGYKISAGSNGHVAWRQTPRHHSHASRGPPRPLRRSLQGLDPSSTANLFSNSICIGEKTIDGEDCFILKLEARPSDLRARSNGGVEIMRHTVWGYFSQRTGLLTHLEDIQLVRSTQNEAVFWETHMGSSINDYRAIDGVNIAHGGQTTVSLFRFGRDIGSEGESRTRMEEVWTIEEVDFNIKGLSMDCFLPPDDMQKDGKDHKGCGADVVSDARLPVKIGGGNTKGGGGGDSRIAAVDYGD